jgi:hypothetical protein
VLALRREGRTEHGRGAAPEVRSSLHRRSCKITLGLLAGLGLAVGGCNLITGASSLTIEAQGDLDAGAPRSDGAAIDASSRVTRLREVTFESGLLVGRDGADLLTGMAVPFKQQALRGQWSMVATDSTQFVEVGLPNPDEIYVTFLFAVSAFPPGNVEDTVLRIGMSDRTVIDFRVTEHLGTTIAANGMSVGIFTVLQLGTVYRAGLHVRTNAQGTLVEGNIATAKAPFDPKNAGMISAEAHGTVKTVQLGAVDALPLTAVFDQLLVDTAQMPPP